MSVKFTIVSWLNPLVDCLWKAKSHLLKTQNTAATSYWWISKEVLESSIDEEYLKPLDEDAINLLQESLVGLFESSKTKTAFARMLVEALSNGVISVK